jgi:hypothetical protein
MNDSKLNKIIKGILDIIVSDDYKKGDGFAFTMAEDELNESITQLPLPNDLKAVRGAISKAKASNEVKKRIFSLVDVYTSESSALTNDVALYLLSRTDDWHIGEALKERKGLSEEVRAMSHDLYETRQ